MIENHPSDNFDDELLSAEFLSAEFLSAEFLSAEFLSAEFLSAYVDGELTDKQLALVEQRLADEPQAQQLVEELRALSLEVRSLPRETVGEDLRATIMQRAERAMLLGTGLLGPDEQPTLRLSEPRPSRRWIWAAMAVAAALLLSVYLPNTRQEEKPLASAKPAPADEPQGDLRLEADIVASDADSTQKAESEALSDETLAVSANEANSPASFRARAARVPPAVAPAAAAMNKMLDEEIQPAFQVHITLTEGANRFENFDQLLVSNGIALEEAHEPEEREQSGQKDKAAGAKYAATRRQYRQLLGQEQAVQEEVFLVEAPTAQIESVLEACSSDIFNCASIRLIAEKETAPPLDNLRQYERSVDQLDIGQLKELKQKKRAINSSQLGRAMRLKADQYQREANGQLNFNRKLLAKSKLSPSSPVQVLFILQQPTGEPASAGGAPSPTPPPTR